MIPFRLDYVIDKTLNEGACEEQEVLKELAGVRLRASEARAEWPRVLEHKWLMSERLGRDVGLRVAALDYFENVRLPRHARLGQTPRTRVSGRTALSQRLPA